MQTPRFMQQINHSGRSKLGLIVLATALFAVACSGGDVVEPQAIETNDGGVLIKPPDVLEGDPAPTPVPAESEPAESASDAPATPVVDFVYFDGTAGSTADFAGRPTVLNFWASNCAACVAEMPEFEEAFQALRDEVDFVGVNVADVSRESAVRLAEQTGVTYPLVDDTSSAIFREFGGFVMPTTIFLHPDGTVAWSWAGILTLEELRKQIDEHIAPGSNSDV